MWLYVATEHDSVYAIDADSGAVYAQVSLIPAGGTTVRQLIAISVARDLVPEVGITGTPVIDPATSTLYVVAKSKVNGSSCNICTRSTSRRLTRSSAAP